MALSADGADDSDLIQANALGICCIRCERESVEIANIAQTFPQKLCAGLGSPVMISVPLKAIAGATKSLPLLGIEVIEFET